MPEAEREHEVAAAYRQAAASVRVPSSFPLNVASEDRLTELGVLGPVWQHEPTDGERLSLRHDAGESAAPYVAGTLLAIRAVPGRVGLTRGLDRLLD